MPKYLESATRRLVRLCVANTFPMRQEGEELTAHEELRHWDKKALMAYEFYEALIAWESLGKNPYISHQDLFEMATAILFVIDIFANAVFGQMTVGMLDQYFQNAMKETGSGFDRFVSVITQIEERVIGYEESYFAKLRKAIGQCESPLEIAFLAGFLSGTASAVYLIKMEAQYQIGEYRVDFAFTERRIVIEVDGHTYHEKTPKQAADDRKRDRTLTQQGWTVFRFHRLEIEQDLSNCIEQVYKILKADSTQAVDLDEKD